MSPQANCSDANLAYWLGPNPTVVSVTRIVPEQSTQLLPAVPNPASSHMEFAFRLPRPEAVDLSVYDIAGARVARLALGKLTAGMHTATWGLRDQQGHAVRPGLYWGRLDTPDTRRSRILAVVR